ncbi:MAG: ABC-type transport auxiliary lipoprotein family protein [Halothiobacillaceae bacterium]
MMPRLLTSLALSLLLAGCGLLPDKPVTQTGYRLEPVLPRPAASAAASTLTVQVLEPVASASYATDQIAYRREPYRIDYYSRSRWAEPPAEMLGDLMARALEDAGLFRVVLGPAARLPADLRLHSELTALEHIIRDPSQTQGSEVRLAMRVQLVEARSARVLATQTFEIIRPAFSADAPGAVAAANDAVREALATIIVFCREHIPIRAP